MITKVRGRHVCDEKRVDTIDFKSWIQDAMMIIVGLARVGVLWGNELHFHVDA